MKPVYIRCVHCATDAMREFRLRDLPRFYRWSVKEGWTVLPCTYPVVLSLKLYDRHKEYTTDGKWIVVKPMDYPLIAAWRFEEDFG